MKPAKAMVVLALLGLVSPTELRQRQQLSISNSALVDNEVLDADVDFGMLDDTTLLQLRKESLNLEIDAELERKSRRVIEDFRAAGNMVNLGQKAKR